MMAQITKGANGIAKRHVIHVSLEDSYGAKIKPSLEGLGGDPGLISCVDGLGTYEAERDLTITDDPHVFDNFITENTGFIIVDPFTGMFGGHNTKDPTEVHTLVRPWQKYAQETGLCVIFVGHTKKELSDNPLDNLTQSHGFGGQGTQCVHDAEVSKPARTKVSRGS